MLQYLLVIKLDETKTFKNLTRAACYIAIENQISNYQRDAVGVVHCIVAELKYENNYITE